MNNSPKFKAYSAAYQSGAADLCLSYLSLKQHGKLTEDWRKFYEENIKKLTDEAEPDEAEIVDEIESNLMSIPDEKSRETYLFGVITAFSDWADAINPIEQIKLAADVPTLAQRIRKEADETRKQINQDEYAHCWATSFRMFVGLLDSMLLSHGIDLMMLQEECGVYLQVERDIASVGTYLGSVKLAKKYIQEAAQIKPQQEEKPILIDDSVILMKVFTEWNGEIWVNIDVLDFVAMMRTGDLSNLKILRNQNSKMRKILGGIRLTISDKEKSNQWCANVKNTTGIDAKRATPNVSDDEILNSSGMREFKCSLSRIFTAKAK